jgi:hypothetical protein
LITGNERAPRLDVDRRAVGEAAHVELTGRRALHRPVRDAVDHHAARTADPLAAVVVEGDRLFLLADQRFVDDVEHLKERHVRG